MTKDVAESDFVCQIPDENGIKLKCNRRSAQEVVASARAAFDSGKTKSVKFRSDALKKLLLLLEENEDAFVDSLKRDLGRSRHEALSLDIELCKNDIVRILSNLNEWVKPLHPTKPLANKMDCIKVLNDPYGVVLVASSWNFPVVLLLAPLAAAISAGNCVVTKPSEVATSTERLIANLVPKYLDVDCYPVYLGGVKETTALLEERFDYIFFTGSTNVGRIVHAAANKFLTPVTLEMGGKSPVYIDRTANMEITVRRILWGKCTNAGQICISPDYVLCSEEVQQNFVRIARRVLKEWYGDDIKSSPDYARIVNEAHYNRLVSYLSGKSNIAFGGQTDASQRYIEPTILTNVSPNHPVMIDEIFGPILPFIVVKNVDEAVSFINAREKPLALYVFTKQQNVKDLFLTKTSSGGVVINDTLVQYSVLTLPFGGVGLSGMGRCHGKDSFDTFVHKKGVVEKSFQPILEKASSVRYPPFTTAKTSALNMILRFTGGFDCGRLKLFFAFCLGIVFVVCVQLVYYYAAKKSPF